MTTHPATDVEQNSQRLSGQKYSNCGYCILLLIENVSFKLHPNYWKQFNYTYIEVALLKRLLEKLLSVVELLNSSKTVFLL